jgi:filamentous hemagglutinin
VIDNIDKITQYLLNDEHPQGGLKSKFLKGFGFSRHRPDELKEALEAHPIKNVLSRTEATDWGIRFVIDCSIDSPDGRNPCIRTVWQLEENSGHPKFVTAFPRPKLKT